MKKLNFIPIPKKKEKDPYVIDIYEEDIDMSFFNDTHPLEHTFIRGEGEFEGKSIFLDDTYDYVVGKDNKGSTILVPLIKKKP